MFTDIHWGAKGNSELHNQDCQRFIEWVGSIISANPSIDSIAFLGDWYENRSAINILTMKYSQIGAETVNSFGLPVFFCIGNHDLFYRHTRDVYSPITFRHLSNINIIDHTQIVPNLGPKGSLLVPYLFHDEYASLTQYQSTTPVWFGHFEFKGFVVTGYSVTLEEGPDAGLFTDVKRIFSGHFHKRQVSGNVAYIGNTFPTNFGDAGDRRRGVAIYTHDTDDLTFIDWPDAPLYEKMSLSDILDGSVTFEQGMRIKCLIDVPISYEESLKIRDQFVTAYGLREFIMEETLDTSIQDTETTADVQNMESVDDLVLQMLNDVSSDKIDNNILISEYRKL